MFDTGNTIRSPNGNFPNIIYKKKLAPLPLFKQNQIQKLPLTLESPAKSSPFGFGINSKSAGILPATMKASPSKTFLSEFKTVNNYGRLCDQPFLEFTSFHYEQVFGSGGGKKKLKLDPIQQKKDKKKIQKMYTIGLPNNSTLQSSAIKVEDNSTTAAGGHSTFFKDHKEHEVESPKTAKTVQKVYKIGDYEALISFVSIQISLVPTNRPHKAPLVMLVKRDDLKKIYKKPPTELAETIIECLQANNNRISLRIGKENAQSSRYVGDETYPEKKSDLHVTLDGQDYNVTIHFPRMEITIDALDYHEKIMMKPMYMDNLFEENFDNLQDYVSRFSLPEVVYMGKEEIRNEKLKALPTIIKKVVESTEFGGTMLFKSMEIQLKNTSDFEPQIMMHESSLTPMQRNMNKRKQKDVNNVVLRVPIDELEKILKADVSELVDLMKESIIIEEGKGFSLAFDPENTKPIQHRDEYRCENFPQGSEKFNVRFNRFLYEVYIKFPTLELYVPETNFKDVIQLSPSQLQDLINNTFENMQDYLEYFRKPTSSQRDRQPTEQTETEGNANTGRTPIQSEREFKNPIISITEAKDEEPIEEEDAYKPGSEDAIAESHEVVLTPKAEKKEENVERDAVDQVEPVEVVENENKEENNVEATEVVATEEAAVETVETENQEEKEENKEEVVENEKQEENNNVEAVEETTAVKAQEENNTGEEVEIQQFEVQYDRYEKVEEIEMVEGAQEENEEQSEADVETHKKTKAHVQPLMKYADREEIVAVQVAKEIDAEGEIPAEKQVEAKSETPKRPEARIQVHKASGEDLEMTEGAQEENPAEGEVNVVEQAENDIEVPKTSEANVQVEIAKSEQVEEIEMTEGAQEENPVEGEVNAAVEQAENDVELPKTPETNVQVAKSDKEEIEMVEGAQEENPAEGEVNAAVEQAENNVDDAQVENPIEGEINAEEQVEANVSAQKAKADEPEEVEAIEGAQEDEEAQEENKKEEENLENVVINNDEKVEQEEVEGDVIEGQTVEGDVIEGQTVEGGEN